MSNFRLNAKKPNKNAGLPTPKSEIYLLYVEDIISMPQSNPKGVVTEGNILIADGRRFHVLYLTPSTQTHNRDTEGDVDSRGWKKKIVGHYPGDEIEINEFIKNNTNQGFVIVVKSCGSNYKKIYGSKCNPLFFTGAFIDDSEKKGYDLTFEQQFADADPVLFYDGNILVDEDALDPNDPEFSTLFVKIDGSNISGANKEKLKQALDIGELPSNIALVDEGDDEGNTYTKLQADDKFLKKTDTTISAPTSEYKYVYLTNEANETRRMLAGDLGKNIANSTLVSIAGAGFTQGANWIHNTAGFHYYLKGLPNKYADQDFNKKLVIDESGRVALSEREDITLNIDDSFEVADSIGTTKLIIDHIYPEQIPERPDFANEIQQVMSNYKNIIFEPITPANSTVWTKNNVGRTSNTMDNEGNFTLNSGDSEFGSYSPDDIVSKIEVNGIILPNDKNWIVKCTIPVLETGYRGGKVYVGVTRGIDDDAIIHGAQPGQYATLHPIGGSFREAPSRTNALLLIVKVNNVILTAIYGSGKNSASISNAYPELGDYFIKAVINKGQGSVSGKFSYKILN